MKKHTPLQYSTYARTIISELKALSVLIRKYSTGAKESAPETKGLTNLLTMTQIEEALLNPQNALQPSIAAYAAVLKLRHNIQAMQERSKTQRNLLQESAKKLRQKIDDAVNESQKEEFSAALDDIDKSNKKLAAAAKQLKVLEQQTAQYEEKVITLIKQYDGEWEQYREHFLTELAQQLENLGIPLSEIEKQDLLTKEAWPQVMDRFMTSNVEVPGFLNIDTPKFATYFKLKAYLAIHASLNRRMQPSRPEDILKLMKQLPL